VIVTGPHALGRRLARQCGDAGVSVRFVDEDPGQLEQIGGQNVSVHRGDAGDPEVLRTAGAAEARILVVTHPALAEKMRICIAARQVSPHIQIVATAASKAERAWLDEFGSAFVVDALDEMSVALLRSIRSIL
jgi:CPA2 family monovalent cation:H+ antiporter-2